MAQKAASRMSEVMLSLILLVVVFVCQVNVVRLCDQMSFILQLDTTIRDDVVVIGVDTARRSTTVAGATKNRNRSVEVCMEGSEGGGDGILHRPS